MKEKFPENCSLEQGNKIVSILNISYSGDEDFERHELPKFNVTDIFRYLPNSITFNDHRGDLCVSSVDIAYFSIGGDWKHILIHHEPIPLSGDIYDAFINMIIWLKENKII